MLGRALVAGRAPAMASSPLVFSQRTLISGMASNRIPRGMAPLAVRDSEQAVEELAEAYVKMDLKTMSEFHKKAMAEMLRGSGAPHASINYEEHLLQAMDGGGAAVGGGAAAPVAAVASAAEAAVEPAASAAASSNKKAADKVAFDVTLKKYPAENKIKLIKELRAVCGLGIQEAKSAIEKCPGVIARHVQTADAEKLKSAMVKLGAEVELT